MAKLIPFRGLRFSNALSKDIQALVSPPYDIISASEQQKLYRAHPNNIIRLEYGKAQNTDHAVSNQYTRAAATLKDWIAKGVLTLENKDALYLLRSEYQLPGGGIKTITGLFARVHLEAFGEGKILPHEKTFQGPKNDRLNLLRETGVSFSPIFALYRDTSGRVKQTLEKQLRRKSLFHFADAHKCTHTLWGINQPSEIEAIQKVFQGKKLLIADGHHRYATALNYQQMYGKTVGEAADYVMMCLTEIHDPGLTVLPVYRIIHHLGLERWKHFDAHVEDYFEVEKVSDISRLPALQAEKAKHYKYPLIGYLRNKKKHGYLLKVKACDADFIGQDGVLARHSRIYCRLDVVILNHLILEKLLGMRPSEEKDRISYSKNFNDVLKVFEKNEAQAVFMPGLPNVDAIWDLAKQGEVMPQKSTYFLPKLLTGLIMNPVNIKS